MVARLLQLTDVLALWRASSEALGRALDGAQAALVASVDAQNATLQRMLYDAGVTREQLGCDRRRSRAATRRCAIELWAIAEELLWQLHAAANQLKRRWRGADAGAPHPGELAAWFAAVAALDDAGVGGRREARVSALTFGPREPRRDNRSHGFIGSLLDFVLHVDVHLATFVRAYGAWVYALLFAIIFIETGVVVMPFLPGDSLLFVVGAMCAVGLMSLPLVLRPALDRGRARQPEQLRDRPGDRAARVLAGRNRAGSTSRRSTRRTRSTRSTAASRSSPRASCRSCAPSRPSSPASRR